MLQVTVALAATLTGPVPVIEYVAGIVKLIEAPTFTVLLPTLQTAPSVGVALFAILNVRPVAVKLVGLEPLPSELVPQVLRASRLPDAFE